MGQVIVAIRNAVHAAKYLKDTHHDLQSFREAVDDHFNAWYSYFRNSAADFYDALSELQSASSSSHRFEMLVKLKRRNEEIHADLHGKIHKEVALDRLTDLQISTLLNVNREFYLSCQSLLAALSDALLDTHGATDFESLPAGA